MALGLYEDSAQAWRLPHQPIPLAVFLVVEQAIRVAWEMMLQRPRNNFQLHREDEDPVTAELWERLLNEVFNRNIVPGFDSNLLMKPTRETKVPNYDGTNTELMPDLLIGLQNRLAVSIPAQDWLFIECKPVQLGRSAGAHYCDKGIIRFVRGDYAWAMTSALMVGYAATNYHVSPKLTAALRKSRTITTTAFPRRCRRSQSSASSEPTHTTAHRRNFCYRQTGEQAPPVTLRHLWLKRS
ncbi:MAG: hypothetical protein WDN28_12065 [Chthoniobacter sp.]